MIVFASALTLVAMGGGFFFDRLATYAKQRRLLVHEIRELAADVAEREHAARAATRQPVGFRPA